MSLMIYPIAIPKYFSIASGSGRALRSTKNFASASSARPVPLQSATRATSQTTQVKPEGRHSSATNQSIPIRVLQSREVTQMFGSLAISDSFLLKSQMREVLFRKPAALAAED